MKIMNQLFVSDSNPNNYNSVHKSESAFASAGSTPENAHLFADVNMPL